MSVYRRRKRRHLDVLEFRRRVAAIALRTELPVMNVVARMAAHARRVHPYLVFYRFPMTSVTIGSHVGAVEAVTGLVVIEIPGLPTAGVMAGLAARPEPQLVLVLVVFLVARETVDFRVAVAGARMAVLAFGGRMPAKQSKAGAIVIE